MIISKTRLPEITEDNVEIKNQVNSNINVQYSLTLIEASLDYLFMLNTSGISDENSKIIKKLISVSFNKEEQGKLLYSKEMLKELLKDHERIIFQLRKNFEKYKGSDEANFITSIIERHQNIARKLKKSF